MQIKYLKSVLISIKKAVQLEIAMKRLLLLVLASLISFSASANQPLIGPNELEVKLQNTNLRANLS